jgi:hypothetical protein
MSDDSKAVFYWELLKLLLQVAWADGAVKPPERRIILGLGKRFQLSGEQLAELEVHLNGGTLLPAPNFDLLRSRSEEVLLAAEQIVLLDDDIDDEENALLVELHAMFGNTGRPPTSAPPTADGA